MSLNTLNVDGPRAARTQVRPEMERVPLAGSARRERRGSLGDAHVGWGRGMMAQCQLEESSDGSGACPQLSTGTLSEASRTLSASTQDLSPR